MKKKKDFYKKLFFAVFFLVVMGLTFYAVFSDTDPKEVFREFIHISPIFIGLMLISSMAYVGTEAFKIWIMLDGRRKFKYYFRCYTYALIEMFYGGITPSASGGQPIQLLYMKKDGYSFTKGCAAMCFIAVTNKFVLALAGLVIILSWHGPLVALLGGRIIWYYIGWIALVGWTILLTAFILNPNLCQRIVLWAIGLPVKMHIIKDRSKVDPYIILFFDAYRNIIVMLREEKGKAVIVTLLSFLQRFFLNLVTFWVYLGLGLEGRSFAYIMMIQLVVVISSDMIPLPGAQGIAEYISHAAFTTVFGTAFLTTSICATRAVNYYFILFLGLLVVILRNFKFKKNNTSLEDDTSIDEIID